MHGFSASLDHLCPNVEGALVEEDAHPRAARQEVRGAAPRNPLAVEVLDRLPYALFIATERGHLLWANRAGARILSTDAGLLIDCGGGFRSQSPGSTAALLALIARAAQGRQGEMRLDRAPGRGPAVVLASPLHPSETDAPRPSSTDEYKVLLRFIDPEDAGSANRSAVERRLRLLYDLTPAEAAVVVRLGAGLGVQAAANALGISPATVRTHVKHAFDKTNVHRQSGLARLIERLAALDVPT